MKNWECYSTGSVEYIMEHPVNRGIKMEKNGKLKNLKVGEAIILKKEKGVNDTINENIKENEYYVEYRYDEEVFIEIKLAEQPKW